MRRYSICTSTLSSMIIGVLLTVITNLLLKARGDQPCHCRLGSEWDPARKSCTSGCQDGWTGDSCERGNNIALHGMAFQSSTYGEESHYSNGQSIYSADKAVDGQNSTGLTSRNCATTYRSRNPWWYVAFNNSVEYEITSVTIQYYFDAGKTLPCECQDNAACLENGYCPNGCAHNKTGPACQIGSLPRIYAASSSVSSYQGQTLYADHAIDDRIGIIDGQSYFFHCSQTAASDRQPWWMVALDGRHELFVVTSVTIYNQFDSSLRSRLNNFTIVYSTDVSTSITLWTTKHTCYYHDGEFLNLTGNFACTHKAIARSIGIEYARRAEGSETYLTLCEVYVYGYKYQDCSPDYTGPSCVLHSCNSSVCQINGGTCDSQGACLFQECPDKSYAPPLCWMRTFTSTKLVNFDILASDAGSDPPSNKTWRSCLSSELQSPTENTTFCTNFRGRRLAIYVKDEDERMLTLCEVTITGHPSGEFQSLCKKPTGLDALRCRCAGNGRCTSETDFKCPGACQTGWTGEDCRSSLLTTFNLKSSQLSTLCDQNLATQQMCVYGPEKALDNDVTTCASTKVSNNPWWLVQLDDRAAFGIEHVRIFENSIQHASPAKQRLLVLTSNGTSGAPDPTTWHAIPYNVRTVGTEGLTLSNVPVARRLAVYLNLGNATLSICEVSIRGYKLSDEAELSLSNVLLVRRDYERTVYVALNLSKRLWYNNPTKLSLAWQLSGSPGGNAYIAYEGPRWYTFNFQLEQELTRLMTFWWETQYCARFASAQCRNGTVSTTMVVQSDEY